MNAQLSTVQLVLIRHALQFYARKPGVYRDKALADDMLRILDELKSQEEAARMTSPRGLAAAPRPKIVRSGD